MTRTAVLPNRYGHVVALRSKSFQKRETTCGASEPLQLANMGIKLILYVVLMDYNRFKVDTGSTSGFAQKNFFRMFKSMETSDSCIEKSILKVFRGTEAASDTIKVLSAFLISEKS